MPAPSPNRVPLWARAADLVCLLLIIAGIHVAMTGGYRTTVLGMRVSVTNGARILAWALALVAVRHWFVPRRQLWRTLFAGSEQQDRSFDEVGQRRLWQTGLLVCAAIRSPLR